MILGLDTTTENLYLALVDCNIKSKVWTKKVEISLNQNHSMLIIPSIDNMLEAASVNSSNLSGLVACIGPGRFTSIRVGLATANGLALTGLPIWGYSSFQLRARSISVYDYENDRKHTKPTWIILDGQRQEVFIQLWHNDKPLTEASRESINNIKSIINNDIWWSPNSFIDKVSPYISSMPKVISDESTYILKGLVSLCNDLSMCNSEVQLIPFYMRDFDAKMCFSERSEHTLDVINTCYNK